MTTYFAEFAWLGGDRVEANVRIDVVSERIVAVRSGAEPAGERLRGTDSLA